MQEDRHRSLGATVCGHASDDSRKRRVLRSPPPWAGSAAPGEAGQVGRMIGGGPLGAGSVCGALRHSPPGLERHHAAGAAAAARSARRQRSGCLGRRDGRFRARLAPCPGSSKRLDRIGGGRPPPRPAIEYSSRQEFDRTRRSAPSNECMLCRSVPADVKCSPSSSRLSGALYRHPETRRLPAAFAPAVPAGAVPFATCAGARLL